MYAEAMFLQHMEMDLYFHHASFRSLAARWNATWGKAMEGCMGNDGYVDPTGRPMENAWVTYKVLQWRNLSSGHRTMEIPVGSSIDH